MNTSFSNSENAVPVDDDVETQTPDQPEEVTTDKTKVDPEVNSMRKRLKELGVKFEEGIEIDESVPDPTPMDTYHGPKSWDELNTDEKVERMREIVKQQEHLISNLSNQSSNVQRHRHNKDGHPVIEQELWQARNMQGMAEASSEIKRNYF